MSRCLTSTLLVLLSLPSFALADAALEAPHALKIKDHEARYQSALEIRAALDFKKDGGGGGHLENAIEMKLDYTLSWRRGGSGYALKMTISNAQLAWDVKLTGEKERAAKKRWAFSKETAPIVLRFEANQRGEIMEYEGESLRRLFAQLGCPRKLAKIPSVYLLPRAEDFKGFAGALQRPWSLPEAPAAAWRVESRVVLGITDSLLDDFSAFRERWGWRVVGAGEDGLRLAAKLEGFTRHQAGDKEDPRGFSEVKIDEGASEATLEPKTGLMKSMRSHFKVSYRFDEAESHKGSGSFVCKINHALRP